MQFKRRYRGQYKVMAKTHYLWECRTLGEIIKNLYLHFELVGLNVVLGEMVMMCYRTFIAMPSIQGPKIAMFGNFKTIYNNPQKITMPYD
jgi:hypothetical protein